VVKSLSTNGDRRGVRIGLIGCGQWGLNYLRIFGELDGCRVAAASDISPERLRIAERRSPGLITSDDLKKLLDDGSLHALVVATDASSHYRVVRSVLEAGKDCLVEKPLTTDIGQARELRDLARERGRILMVGHVFRYNAGINYVRQLISAGAIGTLQYLYFTRTNLGPIRSDVNVVWDLMTHDVSILLHLANQSARWVSAQGASYLRGEYQDVAFATIGFDHGVVANIRASWLDPRKVREITIVGTSKMVVFDDLDSEPVRIFDKGTVREPTYETFGEFKLVTRTGDVLMPAIPPSEPLRNQCQHFVNALVNRSPVLSDADDGLRVVEILAAINHSIAENGAPIALAPALVAV
jgi:predicted dehydrogenase